MEGKIGSAGLPRRKGVPTWTACERSNNQAAICLDPWLISFFGKFRPVENGSCLAKGGVPAAVPGGATSEQRSGPPASGRARDCYAPALPPHNPLAPRGVPIRLCHQAAGLVSLPGPSVGRGQKEGDDTWTKSLRLISGGGGRSQQRDGVVRARAPDHQRFECGSHCGRRRQQYQGAGISSWSF